MTEIAEKDPDEIVRRQSKEFIADTVARAKTLSDRGAITRAVVQWGKSPEAGPYIKGAIVYLLKDAQSTILEDDSLRFYSLTELELLDKTFDAYTIHAISITGPVATAVLKMALDPPKDPVPFPYAGWTLTLEKTDGNWSVVRAVKNEPRD